MTPNQLISELQALAEAGKGDLPVLADGDACFYDPVVSLEALGSMDDPASEKFVRISPT